jgi:hypothetical protein
MAATREENDDVVITNKSRQGNCRPLPVERANVVFGDCFSRLELDVCFDLISFFFFATA